MQVATAPDRLPWTGDDEADRLLAADPLALLIGFVLDQQVPLQKAFIGPLELCRRIGTLDARTIAEMDTATLEAVFAQRPAIHRFPGNMARRTQALCQAVVRDYGGHAERVWTEAADARDLERRLLALPGVGVGRLVRPARRAGLPVVAHDSLAPAPASGATLIPAGRLDAELLAPELRAASGRSNELYLYHVIAPVSSLSMRRKKL